MAARINLGTKERIREKIRELWSEDAGGEGVLSTAEIGRRLGISKNVVIGQAHRMNLPPRPSPIKRREPADNDGSIKREKADRLSLRAGKSTLPPLSCGVVRIVEKPVVTKRLQKSEPCCWPIGEPGKPSFHFCNVASLPGKPYCEDHYAIGVVETRTFYPSTIAKLAAL